VQAIFHDPYRDVAYSTLLKLARALGVGIDDIAVEEPDEQN
jgi:hypothetical protein